VVRTTFAHSFLPLVLSVTSPLAEMCCGRLAQLFLNAHLLAKAIVITEFEAFLRAHQTIDARVQGKMKALRFGHDIPNGAENRFNERA
jgi:hypothetical protein